MNEFRYIVGVTSEVQQGLAIWENKIREYLNTYYQGDRENAKDTKFYRCISKTREINSQLLDKEDFIRSVIDDQNLLASICITQRSNIVFENEFTHCLEIENLSNSPWNTLRYQQAEKRKGSATSLIEYIILESRNEGLNIVKLFAVPQEKDFYESIGFEETNGSGEMVLNRNAASMFLLDQEQRRESRTFD